MCALEASKVYYINLQYFQYLSVFSGEKGGEKEGQEAISREREDVQGCQTPHWNEREKLGTTGITRRLSGDAKAVPWDQEYFQKSGKF